MTLRAHRIRSPKAAALEENLVWRKACKFAGERREAGEMVPKGLIPQGKVWKFIEAGLIVPLSACTDGLAESAEAIAQKDPKTKARRAKAKKRRTVTTKPDSKKKAAPKGEKTVESPAHALAKKANSSLEELAELYDVAVEVLIGMTEQQLAEMVAAAEDGDEDDDKE